MIIKIFLKESRNSNFSVLFSGSVSIPSLIENLLKFIDELARFYIIRLFVRNASVAQLDRVVPSEGKGHGFDSRRERHLKRMWRNW